MEGRPVIANEDLLVSADSIRTNKADSSETVVQSESENKPAIVLVDSSGSTKSVFDTESPTIFDKFKNIVKSLPHDNFRIIFWSSNTYNRGNFKNGVAVIPFVVKKDAVDSIFKLTKENADGSTQPDIGMSAILPEWKKDNPIVYFLTDGQYDSDRRQRFSEEIQKLNLRLVIIAVENKRVDMNNLEVAQRSAGGDVFRLIQDNRLTKMVMKFVSHNLSGSFVQFSRSEPPKGYIPFGDKFFSELHVTDFIRYIRGFLNDPTNKDESIQLEVAQKLSITLDYLTKDKPTKVANDIVRMFSGLFTLDKNLINYVLSDAVQREREGNAAVLANYRAQLKDLFRQATELLKRDVFGNICGNSTSFMSVPVFVSYGSAPSVPSGKDEASSRILTGSFRLVDKSVFSDGFNYPRGGFTSSLPVLPMLNANSNLSLLEEQCLRQWTRTVFARIFGTNNMSDDIIYLVMGVNFLVSESSVSRELKEGYRRLVRVMLNKKRSNTVDTTEYDRLIGGEAPVPNSGRINDFISSMLYVRDKLGGFGNIRPLDFWYKLCLAYSAELAQAQEKHCELSCEEGLMIASEFALVEDKVSDTFALDYSCIVTLEDVSQTGGFVIEQHNGMAGVCAPVFVLSEEGKRQMVTNPRTCICPVCYTQLEESSFKKVGPKDQFVLSDVYNTYESKFSSLRNVSYNSAPSGHSAPSGNNNNNNARAAHAAALTGAVRNANKKTGKLVILKGTVGCGKTTFSERIREQVTKRGGSCYVVGKQHLRWLKP